MAHSPASTKSSVAEKTFACRICQQRKVKCDRKNPCARCVKGGLECVTIPPLPSRRGKRKTQEPILPRPKESHERNGRLVPEEDGARYIENVLWMPISEENRVIKDEENVILAQGGALLFGSYPTSSSLKAMHPSPSHMFRLWQSFLNNAHPLLKIIHAPTVQQQLLDASADLNSVPRNTEALLFAIYGAAVNSMTDNDCQMQFNDTKSNLMKKYLLGSQHSLILAGLLRSSNLVVLQAFTLSLSTMDEMYDSRTLVMLVALAMRLGQGIGLHRDGTLIGIPPFETEMRRRLWWQLWMLHIRTCRTSGFGLGLSYQWDCKLPTNVFETELHPAMTTLPADHPGVTDMVCVLFRCHCTNFIPNVKRTEMHSNEKQLGGWQGIAEMTASDRKSAVDDLKDWMHSTYLVHCDPLIPVHRLTLSFADAIFCKLQIVMLHYMRCRSTLSRTEHDACFWNSLKVVECDNLVLSTKSLDRFLWQMKRNHHFEAFVFLVDELRYQRGEKAERGWRVLAEAFSHRPEMITTTNPLYAAFGQLVLTAWEANPQAKVPSFIAELYKLSPDRPEPPSFVESQAIAEQDILDISPSAWAEWDELFQGLHLPFVIRA